MKQILYSFLLIAGISAFLYSCSSGDYAANSANPANSSINPLNPLTTSQFNWPAVGTFSATINGAQWVADTAWYALDTNGANIVWAWKNNHKEQFNLYLINTWGGNLYNMGHKQYYTSGAYSIFDSTSVTAYVSYLGNSGELYMQQNDTVNFQGRFYFQGVTAAGQVLNVTNGYFNLKKY